MSEHIASRKIYYFVFFGLLSLTLLTWQIAYINLGRWNTVVAFVISVCKTGLVATFFMHLRWSASMTRLVFFAAIFWLAVMMTLTLGDIFTRNAVSQPQPWQTSIVVSHPAAAGRQR